MRQKNMLLEEAKVLRVLLKGLKKKTILNIGSMSTKQLIRYHPWCLDDVINPLMYRKNKIHGLDMVEGEGVDIICDCQDMRRKVGDKIYDAVLFTNTIEHLFYPHSAISEIYRVLKSKGVCYASCPSTGYPYHEDPIDTMLRIATLEDWQRFFISGRWEIDLFKVIKSYRTNLHRVDEVTIIRANKL